MASESVLLGGLVIVAIMGIVYAVRTDMRLKKLLLGKQAASLEDTLVHVANEVELLRAAHRQTQAQLAGIEARLAKSIQKVETVRFNAFRDSGGGQSFATTFLDEKGNGVILSTLYSRDRVSMFSKPIQGYASTFTLSPEEDSAIKKAREQ